MKEVSLRRMAEYFKLENMTPQIPLDEIYIENDEINRPALQLTGYYKYFDNERIQLIGQVEESYLSNVPKEQYRQIWKDLFSKKIPCIVVCRGLECRSEFLEEANRVNTPILRTQMPTTQFMGRLIQYLRTVLAPQISIHGVLVDIYGEGVLITGESGIGKSETALELVRRGHRLVADDMVEIRRVGENELIGTSPEVLRYFVELRGIGIVNVKEIYGVEAVKESQKIDMVIHLEAWDSNKTYDRVGMVNETTMLLGSEVVCYTIPIHPGRNLAVIIETATINHRARKLGYNAAEELTRQVSLNIQKRQQEREEAEKRKKK